MEKVYIVEAMSGVHHGNCCIGIGATEKEAIEDAGGKLTKNQCITQFIVVGVLEYE